MACTRGCVGVSICAGNIACIQFQNGTGTDCAGIASGYSRIQINALGELEVCANVGGVCNCAGLTGTDSLTDNGNGSYTHVAVDGTIQSFCIPTLTEIPGGAPSTANLLNIDTNCDGVVDLDFCEGFCTVVSANDCITGVGTDYVLEQFDIIGNQLVIESEAKHYSIDLSVPPNFVFQRVFEGVPTGITVGLEQVNFNITNPSPCRDMDVCMRAYAWGSIMHFETYPGYLMTSDIELVGDFGSGPVYFNDISSQNRLPTVDPQHSNNFGVIEHCFTLTPGEVRPVQLNAAFNCTGGGPCAEATYFGMGYAFVGHTV